MKLVGLYYVWADYERQIQPTHKLHGDMANKRKHVQPMPHVNRFWLVTQLNRRQHRRCWNERSGWRTRMHHSSDHSRPASVDNIVNQRLCDSITAGISGLD